jgi:penicillin-binding protein 1A
MSPLDLATAYAVIANGGFRVEPYLIQRVDNLEGETIFEARPATACHDCEAMPAEESEEQELSMDQILARREQQASQLPRAMRVMDERVNFIIDSILKDVITRGTGRRALVLERGDIAGKTGTTNGPMDAWFSGYNPDVVTSTWVGFDNYTPLGRREFGGTAALPIWIDFMREALQDKPERQRPLPPGLVNVKIDPESGLLVDSGQRNAIFEYFRVEHVPEKLAGEEGPGAGGKGTDDLVRDIF